MAAKKTAAAPKTTSKAKAPAAKAASKSAGSKGARAAKR